MRHILRIRELEFFHGAARCRLRSDFIRSLHRRQSVRGNRLHVFSLPKLLLIVIGEPADPDVAITCRRVVILQSQGFFGPVRRIGADNPVRHAADDLFPMLNEYTIVEDRRKPSLHQLLSFKLRSLEDDVVALPLARLS